ncbi:mRNA capping enzyme, catalytic domain-containing protein [Lasiosphaeria miniovina]|uniref:mRNA-capping enzyme subunit alpha n=1 Tax=Lasiosphaeria miniovina TaxID=1954250 RepID=A0AA40E4K8_9PEZI|nr:mRNA capping enzyme, catalytic domain-containing protein [Lasiosphaeria miniovina]KAK0722313.1 mRNA capping enzyme, catalytic domain-containing protein [Lasiosphaeria miniovina]
MNENSQPIRDIAQPGIKAEQRLLRILRDEIAKLLDRSSTGFPGAQPVSFSRRHLDELRKEDYYVCEKSDGIRYLLYLTNDENGNAAHYLIDRKNDFWWIHQRNLHFPLQNDNVSFHTGTLIDGELVLDTMPDGRIQPKFLVFDLLALDDKADLISKPLDKRLGYFKEHVMRPYKKLFQEFPDELQFQAFQVEMKEMQFSYGIEMMFREVLPSLKHQNDGLIFTCRTSPYQFGTDQHIVKWKPPHDNTVDFRLRLAFPTVTPNDDQAPDGQKDPFIDYDSVPDARLFVFHGSGGDGGIYREFSDPLYLTEAEWEELKALGDPLQDRVVECALDEEKRWRLYRFRDDKHEANHSTTVFSVLDSIRDGITENDLLEAARGIKDSWKMRQQQQR